MSNTPERVANNDESSGVRAYLNEAALEPLLTFEQEQECSLRIQEANGARVKLYDVIRPHVVRWAQEGKLQEVLERLQDVAPQSLPEVLEQMHLESSEQAKTEQDADCQLLHTSLDIAKQKIHLLNVLIRTQKPDQLDRISRLLDIVRVVEEELVQTAKELAGEGLRDTIRLTEEIIACADEARETLRKSNLLFVPYICRSFYNKGLPKSVVLQEGNLGLMRAVETYDGTRGFRFGTYASRWIRQVVDRAILNTRGNIRVPPHVGELVASFKKQLVRLQSERGQAVPHEEAFEVLQLSEEIRATLRTAFQVHGNLLLSQPIGDDFSLQDVQVDHRFNRPEADAATADEQQQVRSYLRFLDPRSAKIIRLLYGLDDNVPRTLEEVGAILNITSERVRQLEAKALEKLNFAMLRDRFHPTEPRSQEEVPYEVFPARKLEPHTNGHLGTYVLPEKVRARPDTRGERNGAALPSWVSNLNEATATRLLALLSKGGSRAEVREFFMKSDPFYETRKATLKQIIQDIGRNPKATCDQLRDWIVQQDELPEVGGLC